MIENCVRCGKPVTKPQGCAECWYHPKIPDSCAGRIAKAILGEFSVQFANDEENYWGLGRFKPRMLAGIIQKQLDAEAVIEEPGQGEGGQSFSTQRPGLRSELPGDGQK
jgi:hypothetical protein